VKRARSALAILVLLPLAAACDGDSRGSDVDCTFGDEHPIATTRGGFDAVRVVPFGDGHAAVWTGAEGTFLRPIDATGEPTATPSRIGAGCAAGLDVTPWSEGRVLVACLHPPIAAADKPGAIALITVDRAAEVQGRVTFGEVGVGSRGISVVTFGESGVAVAYFDGERSAVLYARGGRSGMTGLRVVSREGPTPGPPDLTVDSGQPLLTWAETVNDPTSDTLIGEVLISNLEDEPERFASVLYEDAQPVFARDATGLIVGFRDENPAGSRVGLFTARVGPGLRKSSDISRVGRSDAASGTALFDCAGGLYAVAPHSYSRREMLVGVARLDTALESIAGERQIYTSGARYEHGTGLCADDSALLLVAERAASPAGDAVLKAMTLRCDR